MSNNTKGKIKVLLLGSVNGRFAALQSKLTTLQNGKAGPFDVAFCAGPFFASGGSGGGGDNSNAATLKREASALLRLPSPSAAGAIEAIDEAIDLPLPVIFVDVGRLPDGMSLPPLPPLDDWNAGGNNSNSSDNQKKKKKKDEAEIDIEDDDDDDGGDNDGGATNASAAAAAANAPPGMQCLAPNLYRLIGTPAVTAGAAAGEQREAVADIVQVPVPPSSYSYVPPLAKKDEKKGESDDGDNAGDNAEDDDTNNNSSSNNIDLHKSLTVAFLPPNVRLPMAANAAIPAAPTNDAVMTASLTAKTSHPSYLGCDLLLSSDWGQGICGAGNAGGAGGNGAAGGAGGGALGPSDINKISATLAEVLVSNANNANANAAITTTATLSDVGSYDVAELATSCRPRYHVAPTLHALGLHHAVTSLPYANLPTMSSSKMERKFHPSRFIALGQVVDKAAIKQMGKAEAKARKFVHALGLQPLLVCDQSELMEDGAGGGSGGAVPCPYTDASYGMDNNAGGGGIGGAVGAGTNNIGLSQAQTRRIISEQKPGYGGRGGGSGPGVSAGADGGATAFRWAGRGLGPGGGGPNSGGGGLHQQQRQDPRTDPAQMAAASDPTNVSLFLHGLHRDTTGGRMVNANTIMESLASFGCINVRYPKVKRPGMDRFKNFCFAEFATHDDAARCLDVLGWQVRVRGIQLDAKWSSGGAGAGVGGGAGGAAGVGGAGPVMKFGMPGVPPPPSGPPPPLPPTSQNQRKRQRLTKEEASDSSTLFVKLPPTVPPPSNADALDAIAKWIQTVPEDQLNGDGTGGDRITAETEPALKVTCRHVRPQRNTSGGDNGGVVGGVGGGQDNATGAVASFGFLEFASHAAAAMGLAAVTGSEDGGVVLDDELSKAGDSIKSASLDLRGTSIYWGTPSKAPKDGGGDGDNGRPTKRHRFEIDPRKDCWFCLSSPSCENHLIVDIGSSVYLCMPKGACNPHHALIVPISHDANQDSSKNIGIYADAGLTAEAEQLKTLLKKFAKDVLQKDLLIYERAIPTKGGYQ